MYKQALTLGAFLGALGVVLGAFGAHALKERLSADMLHAYETGVTYQFYHSFALLATGILYSAFPFKQLRAATTLFFIGTILFSGSLYAMASLSISGISIGPVGIVTPIGGLCFIAGWVMLFLGIMQKK